MPEPPEGFARSWYGKDLSIRGLEDYTRIKHVMTARSAQVAGPYVAHVSISLPYESSATDPLVHRPLD